MRKTDWRRSRAPHRNRRWIYRPASFVRFCRDERGVISIVGAFFILLCFALGTVAIDAGHLYLAKRRLQAAVDASALAASVNPAMAEATVRGHLTREGYDDASLSVQVGDYAPDPSVAAGQRFGANAGSANAVRVTKSIQAPGFFSRMFAGDGESWITATAIAARIPTVSFSTGSGLADLSAGDLNRTLGALLGTTLNLTLADYNGLASANIDALTMLDQLAARAGLAAGTYDELADTDISMGQFIAAAQAVLDIHPNAANTAAVQALNLLSLRIPQDVSARLGALFDTTLWRTRRIGTIVQQAPGQTVINLFEAVSAMARLYGGKHIADIGAGISLPVSNTSVEAYLAAGEPMASMTAASVGQGLTTSQIRLAIIVTAANVNLGIASATVRLPVYIEAARGEASVTAIQCRRDGTMATIAATPTAVAARIGTVATGDLKDYTRSPAPTPAGVVSLRVLGIPVTIEADAAATVAGGGAQPLAFTASDIANRTVKSVGGDTSRLLSGLADKLDLQVKGNGITGLVNSVVAGTVMPLLRPLLVSILTSLDPAVASILESAGLRLGTISVGVQAVGCGRPTLVL